MKKSDKIKVAIGLADRITYFGDECTVKFRDGHGCISYEDSSDPDGRGGFWSFNENWLDNAVITGNRFEVDTPMGRMEIELYNGNSPIQI